MITIRKPKAEEMERYFHLRWKVLRAPWGQPEGSERDPKDAECFQLGAFTDAGEVVGCGRIQFNNPQEAQIRYMAVDASEQGRGTGRKIVAGLEEEARREGAKKIILDARENAVPFYEACGYRITAKSYLLFETIQHYRMEKSI